MCTSARGSFQARRQSFQDIQKGHDESAAWLMEAWKRDEEIPTVEHVKFIVGVASESTVTLSPGVSSELEEDYGTSVLVAPPKLNPYAVQTLRNLRDRGCKIGLICNTGHSPGRTLRQLIDKLEILRFSDATIFSDEVGWQKPDPRIFLATAEKLALQYHEGRKPGTRCRTRLQSQVAKGNSEPYSRDKPLGGCPEDSK